MANNRRLEEWFFQSDYDLETALDMLNRAGQRTVFFRVTKKYKTPMDVINLSPEEYNESDLKVFYESKIVA